MEGKATKPQSRPTMYFIGVKTAGSAALRMFPRWAQGLGLENAQLVGLDFPLDASDRLYREAVMLIKDDPLSLGALVTSHKIRLRNAAGDLFDELTEDSRLVQEVSCIYKWDGRLIGHATDPSVSGRALGRLCGTIGASLRDGQALCLGSGGAGQSLLAYFRTKAEDRPERLFVVDRDPGQLEKAQALLDRLPGAGTFPVELVLTKSAEENDEILARLPAHSLVVNATGVGKDIPGSPLTGAAVFPDHGIAWELNYRGDLEFLRQAREQQQERHLTIGDGWQYFLLSWALIVGMVFNVSVDERRFAVLTGARA
ncbi:MAG: shikimate dehydrogenase [Acidobacteria bacterium]|nr:MAG: shikimate dehydrogenase [Acidobacteriota bacterium]